MMSKDKPLICLDSNVFSQVASYHTNVIRGTARASQLSQAAKDYYIQLIERRAQLLVTTVCQEEMSCDYNSLHNGIHFIGDVEAFFVPCVSTNLISEMGKIVTPEDFQLALQDLTPEDYARIEKNLAKKDENSNPRDREEFKKREYRRFKKIYLQEKPRRDQIVNTPEVKAKKALVVMSAAYYAGQKIMSPSDFFDACNLSECCVYGADKYITANTSDYTKVDDQTIVETNEAFVAWLNNHRQERLEKAFYKLLEKSITTSQLQNEKVLKKFMENLYHRQLQIHEKGDSKNNKLIVEKRCKRIMEIAGITEKNFHNLVEEICLAVNEIKPEDLKLTDTKIHKLY